MALSKKIILEVAMNPQDLIITLTHNNDGYNFVVSRGVSGGYKLLFTSESGVSTREVAIDGLKQVLTEIRNIALSKNGDSLLCAIHIDRIGKTLKENAVGHRIKTSELLTEFFNEEVMA